MTQPDATATPRVFVSYSGDDWDCFVRAFATRLRSQGVDAWVAEWEIPGGGSLVKKIFVEGLGKADTIIIVLSKSSVTKPWVADELDLAVVRRIEDQTNLIPVRIDNCTIPQALRATKRVSIRNTNDYDKEFAEILESIFGVSQRPEMGTPPRWVVEKRNQFTGLNQIDDFTLNLLCEQALESGSRNANPRDLRQHFEAHGLSSEQVTRSIRRLEAYHYVSGQRVMTGEYAHVQVALDVFASYSERQFSEMGRFTSELVAEIASVPPDSILSLDPPEGLPPAIFRTILEVLERQGLFHLRWLWSGRALISNVSPRIEEYITQ